MSRHVTAKHAAEIVGITRTSLHRWVRQGRVKRYEDGYDIAELLKAEKARSLDALKLRAGMKGDHAARLVDRRRNDDTSSA